MSDTGDAGRWGARVEWLPRRPSWMVLGACVGDDPTRWIGRDDETKEQRRVREMDAVLVCGACVVQDECYHWAVDNKERGVWGATTDRQRLRARRLAKN